MLLHGWRAEVFQVFVFTRVCLLLIWVFVFVGQAWLQEHALKFFGDVHKHVSSCLFIDVFANEPDEWHEFILVQDVKRCRHMCSCLQLLLETIGGLDTSIEETDESLLFFSELSLLGLGSG